jgi:hypothetical protein
MKTQEIKRLIQKAKRDLERYNKELPDVDENSTLSCISADAAEALDLFLKWLGPSAKEARQLAKEKRNGTQ